MAKRNRRRKSPHPGVKIKKRTRASGLISWRAHYIDPDTGREVAITIDPLACPTKEARTVWAKNLARTLAKRRMDAASGKRPSEVQAIGAAIDGYLETAGRRLRPNTIEAYAGALERLRAWAPAVRVKSTADLTRPKLVQLREHLIALPKGGPKKGGRRGARKASKEQRSPYSVNREVRGIKTVLLEWRLKGMTPNLTKDDITDALGLLPIPHEAPKYLAAAELRKLLAAARRHDDETFEATRQEHAGARPRGSTARYEPISPFLIYLLLSGCRRGEALALTWEMVDLEALDHSGARVGEIRLPAAITKTHRARTIGLEVSPALRQLLVSLKIRSGGASSVFGLQADGVEAARRRLRGTYGAPEFSWQILRSTASTFLTNSHIFGAATHYLSAKQLGHSVTVAERRYAGVIRGISRDARTLEAAMQIEKELGEVFTAGAAKHARTG